jgi:hypothetical protein
MTTNCRGQTIDGRVRIIEFQVEGTVASAGATLGGVPVNNVALNKPVITDSVLVQGGVTYSGSNAVDGNTIDGASRWISAYGSTTGSDNHWIAVDLQQAYTLLRFSVVASPQFTNTYALCAQAISVRPPHHP